MAVQSRIDNTTVPLIKSGYSYVVNHRLYVDSQGRVDPLLKNTVLSKIPVVGGIGLYTPFIAVNANDGSSVPQAIYLGEDISLADIQAQDLGIFLDVPILVGGCCTIDIDLIVWDQDLQGPNSIIDGAALNPIFSVDARACLYMFGIYLEDTVEISEFEN